MSMTIQERYVKAKAELAEAQRDKIRFKLAVEQGKYLPAEEVAKEQAQYISRIRTKLLALPARMAPLLAGITATPKVFQLLSADVASVLNELADSSEEVD